MKEIVFRPALPADALVAGHLLAMSLGHAGPYLFGHDRTDRAEQLVRRLYGLPGNRFSYEYADVALVGNQVAGLLLSHPGRLVNEMMLPMARRFLACAGPGEFARFLWRAIPLARIRETAPQQYYVSNLAVLLEYQRRGIGSSLLAHAEGKARAAGLSACSLIAEIGNDTAYRLYTRVGYRVVQTIETPGLARKIGLRGVQRMVKTLETGSALRPGAPNIQQII